MKFVKLRDKIAKYLKISLSPRSFFAYPKQLHQHHVLSYSQEGEDRVLSRLFEGKKNGFFVDIGAHHPQRFSNTYYFYLKGWRGINIDAMPGSMKAFSEIRPGDINLEIAVSNIEQDLTYYEFNEPALNGFSKKISEERDGLRDYKIIATHTIKTRKVSSILDEYLPCNQEIDFFSVDVEGLDLEVLKSNDWNKYSPNLILAESLSTSCIESFSESEMCRYLESKGYRLYSKLVRTTIFSRIND